MPDSQAPSQNTAADHKPPRQVLIVYSGNTLGELKPCGCAKEEDQGGIERRMGYLNSVVPKESNLLLVDLGDNFKESTRQGRIKARYLMAAMSEMGYDAVTLGDRDLLYGNEFLKKQDSIPWLASNMELEGMNPPRTRIKTFDDGLRVAVLAVADPNLFYVSDHGGLTMQDPAEAVKHLLPEIERTEHPDLVLLLSHMEREKALKLLDLDGVDVVINGHIENESDQIDMQPVVRGHKIFMQAAPLGQKMGELRVLIDGGNKKIFQQRMVRLDSKIPDDKKMTALHDAYDQEIEALFFETLKAKRTKDRTQVYATESTCKTCHAAAHETWEGTRHAHAYATLKAVNKSFDPECLQCHTTGFEKPGGFISEIDTPELKNVQCEMCHGPRLDHSQAPQGGFAPEARQACSQCHVRKHSPNFNYKTYWPKIQH
ncbi:multiheme c-type cytochrome [Nitrospina watsonii]|uniref:multiheme c-type cytochrome n=1 Tax=Nitrospina watsonii TaxID=1323948 RepID=UPI00248FACB4|nr:multiheme c-type cytochrome [Nitrospina watsonii]